MQITTTKLRQNIYKLLDQVIETGIPIEINRNGKTLKIIRIDKTSKLKNLKKRNVLNCEPEEIISMDWSKEWRKKHI
jgi:prevent-host-death family protein